MLMVDANQVWGVQEAIDAMKQLAGIQAYVCSHSLGF